MGLFFIAGALICGPLLRSSIRVLENDERYPLASFDVLPTVPALPADLDSEMANVQVVVLEVGEISSGNRCKRVVRVRDAGSEEEGASGLVWYGLVVQTVAMAVQVMIHAIVQVWGVAVAHMSISPKNTSIRLSFLGSWRTHTPNPYLGRVPEGVTVSCQPCVLGPRGMFKNPNF